jgi:signal transduction histidine kinase
LKTLETGLPEKSEVALQNGKILYKDAYPVFDKDGQMQGVVEVSTDITDARKASEQIAALNEKLDVLGKMTRHDIKNKLQVINNYVFIAEKNCDQNESNEWKSLQAIKLASKQIKSILDFAKDYEMLGAEKLTYFDVGDVFNEAWALVQNPKNVKIVNDCMGLTVFADSLLRELFYNLIDNSLKYGDKSTQISLRHKSTDEQLILIYEDDGVGIPLEIKSKLFSKGFGKGTGLGLYLIKKALEVYGWQIAEVGQPGQGAMFVMTIPERNKNGEINYRIK